MTWQKPEGWITCPAGELERLAAALRFRRWCRLVLMVTGAILLASALAYGGYKAGNGSYSQPDGHNCGSGSNGTDQSTPGSDCHSPDSTNQSTPDNREKAP